jgi:hypothetical protein
MLVVPLSLNFFLLGSSMGDKADWSDGFLRNLFDACKVEIEVGNRPNGQFTSTGLKNFVSKFAQKSSDKRTKKQLKNKLDGFKKDFSAFMEFKNLATGLGWDEAKQIVVCTQEWWDEHLAVSSFSYTTVNIYFFYYLVGCALLNIYFFLFFINATIKRKESNAFM